MKFVQFTYKNKPNDIRLGYLDGDCVVDLKAQDSSMPKTMIDFLQNDYYWKRINELKTTTSLCAIALHDVCLKFPIHGMDKILCVNVNYLDYCENHKVDIPQIPVVTNKFPSTIIGPNDSVLLRTDITLAKGSVKTNSHRKVFHYNGTNKNEKQLLASSSYILVNNMKVDYGVNLCVVIGRETSMVKAEEAHCHIFGYTVAQDICARDLQKGADVQLMMGSSMDTFCPIGPCIATPDEIDDVNNLNIKCQVNGVCKQRSNTEKLVHKIPKIIERISSTMTLFPGDIILTGTPKGVGVYSTPPMYLKPGDKLVGEIQNIGILETGIKNYIPPEKLPRHVFIRWPY